MQRIWSRRRQTCGHDVVWPVASDEGNAPLFQEIRNVGVISGEAGFPRPSAERGAPFPTPGIEKDDIACRYRHALQFFQGLTVPGSTHPCAVAFPGRSVASNRIARVTIPS